MSCKCGVPIGQNDSECGSCGRILIDDIGDF